LTHKTFFQYRLLFAHFSQGALARLDDIGRNKISRGRGGGGGGRSTRCGSISNSVGGSFGVGSHIDMDGKSGGGGGGGGGGSGGGEVAAIEEQSISNSSLTTSSSLLSFDENASWCGKKF